VVKGEECGENPDGQPPLYRRKEGSLAMPEEGDRRKAARGPRARLGKIALIPPRERPSIEKLERRIAELEIELRQAKDHTGNLEDELLQTRLEISEVLGERRHETHRQPTREEDTSEVEEPAETEETGPTADAELERTAFSAAHTGQLALEDPDISAATTDVAISVENFHRCATVLDAVQMDYPMVHMAPSWAPLDLANSPPDWWGQRQMGAGATLSAAEIIDLARYAPEVAEEAGLRCEAMPVTRARQSFARLLTKFLKTRVDALLQRDKAQPSGGAGTLQLPGLEVTVHTEHSGLLVYYAPLYFPATRRVFGGTRSTPVRGYLPPGIYIFGAEGRDFQLSFEAAPWQIPPDYTVTMLRA
jgi:hypothetical protein